MGATYTLLHYHIVFWANKNFQLNHKFVWQEGYGAFTVSKSSVRDVINYIVTQEEHHK